MKRFIAGATCPQCHQQDTLFVVQEQGDWYRQCVRCGFREQRPDETTPPSEPEGAVVQFKGTHQRKDQ